MPSIPLKKRTVLQIRVENRKKQKQKRQFYSQ